MGTEVLKGFRVGTADAVAFSIAVIPEGRQSRVGVEENFPVEGNAIVNGVKDEEFSEVALLPE